MREVPLAAFVAAHCDGAIVVDVREPGEYVGGLPDRQGGRSSQPPHER